MSMIESPAVDDAPPSTEVDLPKQKRYTRDEMASTLAKLESKNKDEKVSIRALSREEGVPESTIRYWMKQMGRVCLDAEVLAFFESPAGVRFLSRMSVALHLIFGLMGGCGPSLLRLFLQSIGLDSLIACSDTTIRLRTRQLQEAVSTWGTKVREVLAKTMPMRKVSLGADETFFAKMVLVGVDIPTDFILLEQTSDQRDAKTWNQHVQENLKGLNVELVQLVGDGAKALTSLAKDMLGIPKTEDLWHGQNAISRGTAGPLAAKLQEATHAQAQASEAQKMLKQQHEKYKQNPGRGRPANWTAREARAKEDVDAADAALKQATENQTSMQQEICNLGIILHPLDLHTGALQDATKVESELKLTFNRMREIVKTANLGERSQAGLRKAARLIPAWVASVKNWHDRVEKCLSDMMQPMDVVTLVRNVLIPLLYVTRVIGQTRDDTRTKQLQVIKTQLYDRLSAPDSLWLTLPISLRHTLLAVAQDCVDIFQRSTGCVEGRNGYLSLHHHHSRGLTPIHLMCLTVIHNFVTTRNDGTTAAERFFGRAPDQSLFDHLCEVLPPPARPRKRSRKAVADLVSMENA